MFADNADARRAFEDEVEKQALFWAAGGKLAEKEWQLMEKTWKREFQKRFMELNGFDIVVPTKHVPAPEEELQNLNNYGALKDILNVADTYNLDVTELGDIIDSFESKPMPQQMDLIEMATGNRPPWNPNPKWSKEFDSKVKEYEEQFDAKVDDMVDKMYTKSEGGQFGGVTRAQKRSLRDKFSRFAPPIKVKVPDEKTDYNKVVRWWKQGQIVKTTTIQKRPVDSASKDLKQLQNCFKTLPHLNLSANDQLAKTDEKHKVDKCLQSFEKCAVEAKKLSLKLRLMHQQLDCDSVDSRETGASLLDVKNQDFEANSLSNDTFSPYSPATSWPCDAAAVDEALHGETLASPPSSLGTSLVGNVSENGEVPASSPNSPTVPLKKNSDEVDEMREVGVNNSMEMNGNRPYSFTSNNGNRYDVIPEENSDQGAGNTAKNTARNATTNEDGARNDGNGETPDAGVKNNPMEFNDPMELNLEKMEEKSRDSSTGFDHKCEEALDSSQSCKAKCWDWKSNFIPLK